MDPSVLFPVVNNLTVAKQYATASYALFLYEYMITLDIEIKTFWTRKFSFATLLWFMNRYVFVISMVPTLLGYHGVFTDEQCLHFARYPAVLQIVSNIAAGLTLSLRIYALYGKAWWTVIVLLFVLLVEVGLSTWSIVNVFPAQLPPGLVGCIMKGTTTSDDTVPLYWIGQLFFPALAFIMTLTRALGFRRQCGSSLKSGILSIMVRDGFMYFFVIFLANLANALSFSLAPAELRFANATFSNSITTVMICRLMLNLRQADPQTPTASATSLQFEAAVRSSRTVFSELEGGFSVDDETDTNQTREFGSSTSEHESAWKKARFDS